jgi:hypothetical protein
MLIRKPGKTVGAYAKPACVRPRARWSEFESAQKSGISAEELRTALQRMDERMEPVSAMVIATPIVVKSVLRDANTRFDSSWANVMRDVRAQEITLSDTVSAERQAAMDALDVERAAVAADAARMQINWFAKPERKSAASCARP